MKDHGSQEFLTHATGAPVSDNLNIQTAGPRGPALLQDIWLIEKLAHFDREVIPERRMHLLWGYFLWRRRARGKLRALGKNLVLAVFRLFRLRFIYDLSR